MRRPGFAPMLEGYRRPKDEVHVGALNEELARAKTKRDGSVEVRRGGVVRRRPEVLESGEPVEVVGDDEREFVVHEGGDNQEPSGEALAESAQMSRGARKRAQQQTKEEDAALLARARMALKIPNQASTCAGSAGQGGGRPGRVARKRM